MTHIIKKTGIAMAGCLLILATYSCNNNKNAANTKCADSTAAAAQAGTDTARMVTTDSAGVGATTSTATGNMNKSVSSTTTKRREPAKLSEEERSREMRAISAEPSSPNTLSVSSTAFSNYGVIPVKYTCDGQGTTPPINVTNMPAGTKSLTIIVHDYNATPEGGETYWIIWNLDTAGIIPEGFRSDYQNMNKAKQYGNTPLCAKSGDHRYHFIVYALDTKLVIGKNTTKASIEKVMRTHVLAKGDLVGIYNKQLE